MDYSFTTPSDSRTADRPTPVDDSLVGAARHALLAVLNDIPLEAGFDRPTSRSLFMGAMQSFCADPRARDIPVERLIVAVKSAWASMTDTRLRLGEAAPDALESAVSACIGAFFAVRESGRAD